MKCPSCGKSLWFVTAECPFCKTAISPEIECALSATPEAAPPPGLFKRISRKLRGPRCHVDAQEKEWIEKRFLWLQQQFGAPLVRRVPLCPGSTILPKAWDLSYEAGMDLFCRLCEFMFIPSGRIDLHFYSERDAPNPIPSEYERHRSGPAGLYVHPENSDRLVIALDWEGVAQPAVLVATICHELGHVHLLGDRRITAEAEDHEPLTDLLTVYFGAGIFTANSAFQFSQWQDGRLQGWSASRMGYLSEQMFGYALACYAWNRGDLNAAWRRHLRENIAYYFDDSLHYLSTTRETTIPFNQGTSILHPSQQ